jgi:threonine dehydrogenase-like Zn-dependent dehydrogenase
VRHVAGLRAGEQAAVVATGGVGSNRVQIARAFGVSQIIVVDFVPEKLDVARQLGATEVVNGAEEDAVARVEELTVGELFDVAFEVLGRPETFAQAAAMIRNGGRMVAVEISPQARLPRRSRLPSSRAASATISAARSATTSTSASAMSAQNQTLTIENRNILRPPSR